ncbi:pirin family protein [Paraburkholderia sp. J12]|uniref:pirin family protein n=1 Tax=Paraburkholderia sp. J12 TaxID=2805432 RepID=UPI002ABDD163|nr:pirin family protein [Paraburkholderia sp. J12]
MMELRKADQRGRGEHGWLSSRHTFSFANYYDPKQIGFSDLLVINDDRVAPARGFGKHPHRDMEIFSYVLEGALEHKDSMGTGSVIVPGDVQLMSAGTGVTHSEFNHSPAEPVHFLQIWIAPNEKGAQPRYQQKNLADAQKRGKLRLILSPDGADDSLLLRQDARVYAGRFDGAETATLELDAQRYAYVHVARGGVSVNGVALAEGDGARIRDERTLTFGDGLDAEVLVFDLRNNEVSELWS